MARYSSTYKSGETDTNVLDANLLSALLRAAPQGAQLTEGSSSMRYDLDLTDTFVFRSDAGFTAPWAGTINSISTILDGTEASTGQRFAADAAAVRDAIADGDTDALNALFWSGTDRITGSDSDDTLRGFAGRDTIKGNAGNDTLIGDSGADRLLGGSGSDSLFGGSGNDRLFGGVDDDVISGGAGDDAIGGGAGGDTLSGGTGADTFKYSGAAQFAGESGEFITDFTRSQGDKIDVSAIDAITALAGNQAFTFIDNSLGTLDFPPAAGSLVVGTGSFPGTYTVALYLDGTGNAETFIVTGVDGMLTADDFIL